MATKIERFTRFALEDAAKAAVFALRAGKSFGCVAGDHGSGETCAQVIARRQDLDTNDRYDDYTIADDAEAAVDKLRAGRGVDLVSTDHSGTETCVQTIARLG